ncbi:MAG: hypothetical protein RSF30_10010 [Lachnospiraceae bacterium]
MALIKCTECGKEFSDKAEACPNCGCPITQMELTTKEAEVEAQMEAGEVVKKEETSQTEKVPIATTKKKPNVKLIATAVAAVLIAGIIVFFATANGRKYSAAEKDFSSKGFQEALDKYSSLGDYKDSKKKVEECKYELTIDGQYMRAMSEGLMARWDKDSVGENPKAYADFCQTELDKISEFYDKDFDNKDLGADIKTYIDLLKEAKDATKYYTVDYNTYYTRWADVYAKRTILLQKFISKYGLKVDKTHQDTLDKLMTDAEAVAEQKKAKEDIQKMADGFTLNETADEWGYKSYKIHMKNTTDIKFEYLNTEISVLDETGKIISTGSSDQVTEWGPGQEAELEAWIDGVSKEEFSINGKTIQFKAHYSTGTLYE